MSIFIFVVFYWMADSIWSYVSFEMNIKQLIYREPASYIDTMLLNVPPYQILSRLMVSGLFVIIGIMITEFLIRRTIAERQIRASEEKFKALVTNNEEIIFMIDRQGKYLLFQGKGLAVLGLKPDELVGQSAFERYKNDLDIIQSIKIALSGKSITSEEQYKGNYFRSWYSPHRNENNKTIGVLGLSINITKQKKTEQALINSQQRYREAQRMGKVGNWEYNLETQFFWGSEQARRIFGLGLDRDFFSLNEIESCICDKKKSRQALIDLIEKRKPYDLEYEIAPQDNSAIKTIRSIAELQLTQSGKPYKITGVIQDISKQKAFEVERKKLEEQILLGQKMESIGTLAGGIAHDFNNMLGVIFGNITYLLETYEAHEKHKELIEVLSDIKDGAERAQSLTQQLLTFSKGGKPVKQLCDIRPIIKDSADFFTRGSRTKCRYCFADNSWFAQVDPGQLNQVVSNLVINASQAMPEGGIITIIVDNTRIDLTNSLLLPPGNYLKIMVKDMGKGISKENAAKIFDPFFTTKSTGSGLGLTTTYSIIKKHNGHIAVDSKVGQGTTFVIYLPASDSTPNRLDKKSITVHVGKGKVLVMDDDEQVQQMTGRMLCRMGYEPHFAIDGRHALEMYQKAFNQKESFKFVILDLTVPGEMGGKIAVQKLMQIDPNVKAIVSSGYSNDPVMADYQSYGFCGILPKPYSSVQLAALLNGLFESVTKID